MALAAETGAKPGLAPPEMPLALPLIVAAAGVILAKALGLLPTWVDRVPDALVPPAAAVLDRAALDDLRAALAATAPSA